MPNFSPGLDAATQAAAASAVESGSASLTPAVTADSPALLIYTSGTTGPPKGGDMVIV